MFNDPYLTSFLNDIGSGISLVFRAIEIFFGIGYFIGSKTVEGAIWLFTAGVNGYNEAASATAIVKNEIVEFGSSFLRAVLLIYYAAFKIVESFVITAVDIYNLVCHVKDSLTQTIVQTSSFIGSCAYAIFAEVPQQLQEALNMIGESVVSMSCCFIDIVQDFLWQVILSPINAFVTISKWLMEMVQLPFKVVYNMPPASILGLLVVLLFGFGCRKLVRYFVLRNFAVILNRVQTVASKLFSSIRFTHLKNFTSSVWTVVNFSNPGSSGNSSSKATCVICQDKPVSFMSNPCKHVCLCDVCVYDLIEHDNRCPICRSHVSKYDRVFIP